MGKKPHIKEKAEVFEMMKKQKVNIYIRNKQGYKHRRWGKKEDETSSDCKYTSQKYSFFSSEKNPTNMVHLNAWVKHWDLFCPWQKYFYFDWNIVLLNKIFLECLWEELRIVVIFFQSGMKIKFEITQ